MKPKIPRRSILAALVLLAGCAVWQRPDVVIIPAGSSACFGTPSACEVLTRRSLELRSPAMLAAICAAGAMTKDCPK